MELKINIMNKIISTINYRLHLFLFMTQTLLESIYLKAIKIDIGINIEFRGWTNVYLKKNSRVIIGDNCRFNSSRYTNHIGINHPCVISTEKPGAEIIIGNNCGFSGVSINCFKSITIGNNVRVGANCVIADSDFHLDDPRVGPARSIVIKDDVWLGYGVIVMKGVTIGKNSVIGMNSIVTHDIPDNVIAAGNPCKVIKTLSDDIIKILEDK